MHRPRPCPTPPAPSLTRCELHTDPGAAERGEPPHHVAPAVFSLADRVACALPPASVGEAYWVHVRLHDHVPPGASVARLVYYNPLKPATLTRLTVNATGGTFADARSAQIALEVRGANFAPTNLRDQAEDALRCGLWAEPAARVEELRAAEAAGEAPRPEVSQPRPPVRDEEGGPVLEAEARATYVSETLVRCTFSSGAPHPSLASGCLARGDCGDMRLRVAHAVGEYAWSNDSLLLSLYDSRAVAPLTSVTPTFADRHRPVLLELRGSNFVPSGAADARCRFRSRNGDTFANASVVSSELARCVAPPRGSAPADADAAALADIDEVVELAISHSASVIEPDPLVGGEHRQGWATAPLHLRYIDTAAPVVVSSFTPRLGPVHEATHVLVTGSNLAPVGSALRCRFGRAPSTRGGWNAPAQAVDCTAPPGRFQRAEELLAYARGSGPTPLAGAAGVAEGRGVGGALAQLSLDDGGSYAHSTYSPFDEARATFAYYDPYVPPLLLALESGGPSNYTYGLAAPTGRRNADFPLVPGGVTRASSDLAGGVTLWLSAHNLAPTPHLACRVGEAVVPASFVNTGTARCLTPSWAAAAPPLSGATAAYAPSIATVGVRLSLSAPDTADADSQANAPWSEAAFPLTYFDTAAAPQLSTITPILAPLVGDRELLACGADIGPTVGRPRPHPEAPQRYRRPLPSAPSRRPPRPPRPTRPTHRSPHLASPHLPLAPHQAGLRCHFSGEAWPSNVAEAMASPYYGGYASWGLPGSPLYRPATAGCPLLPAPVCEGPGQYCYYDPSCAEDLLLRDCANNPLTCDSDGCAAGGAGPHCRFCGHDNYRACPGGSTAATFVDDTCVRCAVPPTIYNGSVDVHVSIARYSAPHHGAPRSTPGLQFSYYKNETPPSLTSVDPDYLDVMGGGTLTLTGANFAPTGPGQLVCLFGDALRLDATFVDATVITCVVPPCNTTLSDCSRVNGTLELRAAHDGGAGPRDAGYLNFTFYDASAPPALELVLPSSSSFEQHGALIDLAAPSPLTIHAANLAPTAGALRCKFSGGEAGWEAEVLAAFVHGGLASCALPPVDAQMGTRSLSLTHDGGGLWSHPATLTVFNSALPPVVLSFTPWLVPSPAPEGGSDLTLLGSNFAPIPSFACVFVYAAPPPVSTAATFVSDSEVRCTTPAAAAGAYPRVALTLGVGGGGTAFATRQLTYFDPGPPGQANLPVVLGIEPPYGELHTVCAPAASRAQCGAEEPHTVHGSNFAPLATLACRYGFGADAAFDVPATFVDAGTIECRRPSTFPQPLDVPVLASLDGGNFSTTATRFIFYNASAPPTFAAAAPRHGPRDGGTLVYVSGGNFAPLASLGCRFGGVAAVATFDSPRLVRCAAPPWPTTSLNRSADVPIAVSVDGVAFSPLPEKAQANPRAEPWVGVASFTYYDPELPPIVSAISPRFGAVAGGEVVTVSGANFVPTGGRSDMQCLWAALEPSRATWDSHDRLRCVAPAAVAGDVTLGVTAWGEPEEASLPAEDGLADRYTYRDPTTVPTAFAVTPGGCGARAGCALRVSGRGFVPTPTLACTFLPWGSGGGVNGSNASALNGSALSTPATFEAAGALRCAAPVADAGDYYVGVYVDSVGAAAATAASEAAFAAAALHAATATAATAAAATVTAAAAAAHLVLYSADSPPVLAAVSPLYAHPAGGTRLTLSGTNFADTGQPACVFGGEAGTVVVVPAAVDGFARVRCDAPSAADLGSAEDLGSLSVAFSRAGGAAGSVRARLSHAIPLPPLPPLPSSPPFPSPPSLARG